MAEPPPLVDVSWKRWRNLLVLAAGLAISVVASYVSVRQHRSFTPNLPGGVDLHFWLEATLQYAAQRWNDALMTGRPPIYPMLSAALIHLDIPPRHANDAANLATLLALGPAAFLACRQSVGFFGALLVGLVILLDPRLMAVSGLTNSLTLSLLLGVVSIGYWPQVMAQVRGGRGWLSSAVGGLLVGLSFATKEQGLPVLGLGLASLAPNMVASTRRWYGTGPAMAAMLGVFAGGSPLFYQAYLELQRGAWPKYMLPFVDAAAGDSPGLAGITNASTPATWVGATFGMLLLLRAQRWTAVWFGLNAAVVAASLVVAKHFPYHEVGVTPVLALCCGGLLHGVSWTRRRWASAQALLAMGLLWQLVTAPPKVVMDPTVRSTAIFDVADFLIAEKVVCLHTNYALYGVLTKVSVASPEMGPKAGPKCHVVLDETLRRFTLGMTQHRGPARFTAGNYQVWGPVL